jgi:homoserine O-succinyltransferase/O-acetyltransferase
MPVMMDGNRPVPCWEPKKALDVDRRALSERTDVLRIALVNNMPDAALEDTELQFLDLLDAASGEVPVILKLFSLPKVPRTERGEQHLANFYSGTDVLDTSRIDGMIITGTEPRQPNLADEPYWGVMTDLFDWAEKNTLSTVLSCLAAHAGVLHSDGIQRHPLSDKRLGVFESQKLSGHELLRDAPGRMCFPHSRWNEVRADELAAAGYDTILCSPEAGADLFVKMKGNSLFLHFQGHPEYSARTLLKEFRRDIKRYLRGERPNYPSMPLGYFDEPGQNALELFREMALAARNEDLMASFPEEIAGATLDSAWRPGAVAVYRNWLRYIAANKEDTRKLVLTARRGEA